MGGLLSGQSGHSTVCWMRMRCARATRSALALRNRSATTVWFHPTCQVAALSDHVLAAQTSLPALQCRTTPAPERPCRNRQARPHQWRLQHPAVTRRRNRALVGQFRTLAWRMAAPCTATRRLPACRLIAEHALRHQTLRLRVRCGAARAGVRWGLDGSCTCGASISGVSGESYPGIWSGTPTSCCSPSGCRLKGAYGNGGRSRLVVPRRIRSRRDWRRDVRGCFV